MVLVQVISKYFLYVAQQPQSGLGCPIDAVCVSHTITHAHTHTYTRYNSSERVISSSQRPLYYKTILQLNTLVCSVMKQGNPASFTPPLYVMQCRARNKTQVKCSSTLLHAVCQDLNCSADKTASVLGIFQHMDYRN